MWLTGYFVVLRFEKTGTVELLVTHIKGRNEVPLETQKDLQKSTFPFCFAFDKTVDLIKSTDLI